MLDAPKGDGTVAKALSVLDQVATFGRPVRFSELLENSPYPKPTLYRFVQTLTNQGMLAYDADRQTYSPGMRLVRLAHTAWQHSSLVEVAKDSVSDLSKSVGETVHLAQSDGSHVLFVHKQQASNVFETMAQAGRVAPAYCTGVGKAILAFLPDVQQDYMLQRQTFFKNTDATHVCRSTLEKELEDIRDCGVAFDREEHEKGIISVATPILGRKGRVLGAISIATHVSQRSLDDLSSLQPQLTATAGEISNKAEYWQFPT